MNVSPDVFAEVFRQGAFISALIAGFSFSFLAIILTSSAKKKAAAWTAGFSMAATAGLIVCALGWTFISPRLLAMAAIGSGTAPIPLPPIFSTIHRALSITFVVCFFLFLTSLGLGGWIRSKKLGIVSTVIAAVAAVYAVWILHFFIA
jgi:hypothetical protein